MRTLVQLAGIAAVALAGSTVQATEFGPLMNVVHATWPEKAHIGVVADYSYSQDEIDALARSAGDGSTITVLDTHYASDLDKASSIMVNRVKPDFVVLLPHDRMVWDGSYHASKLVGRVAFHGIPTIATTPVALRQGVAFAMGQATGFDLLVADKLIGTVEVLLPQKGKLVASTASLNHGMAKVSVLGSY